MGCSFWPLLVVNEHFNMKVNDFDSDIVVEANADVKCEQRRIVISH